MSRRGKWIIGLLSALLLLAMGTAWYRGYTRERQTLGQALSMLQTPDTQLRLQAAKVVLSHDPGHIEARLVHARESFRIGRYRDSRNDVQAIPNTATEDQTYEMAMIGAHSVIYIARNTILQAPDRGMDTIGGQITELLAQVASYRRIIATDHRDPQAPLIVRALEADVRAMYLRMLLKDIRTQIAQTRSANSTEVAHAIGVQTSDDQLELNLLEQEIGDLCREAIRSNPEAQQPRVLLFKQFLRQGELQQARLTVEAITLHKDLSSAFAVEIANELLNLETRYYLQTTSQDIDLAQRILALVPLAQRETNDYPLVTAELHLAKGEYELANKLLQTTLSERSNINHVHAVCLRARALIGLGRASQAEQVLARFNDRNSNWESKFVQGLAMQADHRSGLDLFRQAQEKEPASLTVRLAICDAIISNGGYKVAELDINQLADFAPMHTKVMQIRLDYAANLGHREIIQDYISKVYEGGLLKLTADDAVLVGHMMLDDVQASEALAKRMLASAPMNPLAMLGSRMTVYPATARAEAARYAVQALYPLINNDPMRWPLPPKFEAWERMQKAQALAVFGQKEKQSSSLLLRGSLYLPWPYETTLDVLTAANERWPQDARLSQLAARVSLWLGRTQTSRKWLLNTDTQITGPLNQAIDAFLAHDETAFNQLLSQLRQVESAGNATTDGKSLSLTDASDPTWQLLELLRSLRSDDMIAAALQVESILKTHPRAEPAMLWLVRQLYDSGRLVELETLLTRFESMTPYLSQIARSRVLVASGQLAQSTQGTSLAGVEALSDTTIRWQQTEVEAIAMVTKQQSVVALGMLETLGLSIHSLVDAIAVGQIELMLDAGRDRAAGSIIMQQLSLQTLAPVWTDAYLARAMYFMEPQRVLRSLDRLLIEQPKNGVLLYYQAKLLLKIGDNKQAQAVVAKLALEYPQSPRSLMLQAQLAMDQARLVDAKAIFAQMSTLGGESERVARMYMVQLADAEQPRSSTQEVTP